MADFGTRYMGVRLANPIIAGASDLTSNIDSIKRIEGAGAGALVLKSLFEEQIQLESYLLEEAENRDSARNAEMASVFPKLKHAGPKEHLSWVRKAKSAVKIPVFASLNSVNRKTWVDYAKQLAGEGVDGIELNFFATPRDAAVEGSAVEREQLDAAREVIAAVKVPVAAKLSVFYSNPLNFISRLDATGVRGLVVFNRFFQPDIDVGAETMTQPIGFSTPPDNRLPLRFAGLLYGAVKADICASTGIMSGMDAAKMILAGASAVQIVTALYRQGVNVIPSMLTELGRWMDGKGYAAIDAAKGKLSAKNGREPWAYTRAQYAKMLLGPKEFSEPVRS